MSEAYYDNAWVCANGHVINSSATKYPQHNKKFCAKCGAPAITACSKCETPIQGEYYVPGVFAVSSFSPPAFCHNCGSSFDWTASAIANAKQLADEFSQLEPSEREILKASVDDLVKPSARTEVAQRRFKTIMTKVGKEGWEAMRSILIDVSSEVVKKSLFGQ